MVAYFSVLYIFSILEKTLSLKANPKTPATATNTNPKLGFMIEEPAQYNKIGKSNFGSEINMAFILKAFLSPKAPLLDVKSIGVFV